MSLTFHSANSMLRDKQCMIMPRDHHLGHRTPAYTNRPGQVQGRTEVPPRPSRDQVKGILRRRPVVGRTPCRPRKRTVDVVDVLRFLWKFALLILIPLAGYCLSRLYPSPMLCHFLALCFIYRVVDLLDHDPSLCAVPSPRNTPKGGQEQTFRNRLVSFAEGTKFYRLPRPMSRKQKQQSQAEHKSLRIPMRDTSIAIGCSKDILGSLEAKRKSSHDAATNATLDWEATNRLLKSLITKHHDETVTHDGNAENQVVAWSRVCNTKSVHSIHTSSWKGTASTPHLSGRDTSIARMNLTKRPLQDNNNRS
jgi:hypothetical protein